MQTVSYYIVPSVLLAVGLMMLISGCDLFAEFTLGAKDGLMTAVKLLPPLVALISAISMFTASGAAEALASLLSPVLSLVGVPRDTVGLISIRPFSGGGATAMLSEIYERYGVDSFTGKCASVIAGSSDTIFYMLGVYFSSVKVTKTRAALPCALFTMLFCVIFGCFLAKNLF